MNHVYAYINISILNTNQFNAPISLPTLGSLTSQCPSVSSTAAMANDETSENHEGSRPVLLFNPRSQ